MNDVIAPRNLQRFGEVHDANIDQGIEAGIALRQVGSARNVTYAARCCSTMIALPPRSSRSDTRETYLGS
jgi:hypothetical protein